MLESSGIQIPYFVGNTALQKMVGRDRANPAATTAPVLYSLYSLLTKDLEIVKEKNRESVRVSIELYCVLQYIQ